MGVKILLKISINFVSSMKRIKTSAEVQHCNSTVSNQKMLTYVSHFIGGGSDVAFATLFVRKNVIPRSASLKLINLFQFKDIFVCIFNIYRSFKHILV